MGRVAHSTCIFGIIKAESEHTSIPSTQWSVKNPADRRTMLDQLVSSVRQTIEEYDAEEERTESQHIPQNHHGTIQF